MVPLTHATREGSDEPAHPHSLARGINAHIQGCRCRCKSKAFLPNSARNFFVCKQQRRRSARAPAQFYQLSLESMIAKPATCKKIKFLSDMRARIQTIPTGGGGGGGGGGGSNCFSREVRTNFSSRKQMATYDFHGEARTPCPLCLRPYQSFKQFQFTFYLIFLLGLVNSQNVC